MVEMVQTQLNGEYNIVLPKHRADREEWHTEGGWEKARLKSLHATITEQAIAHVDSNEPKPVIYYVGAEEGDMCGLCVLWGAEIVMFEPNQLVSPNIKAIWEANGLEAPMGYFEGFAANVTDDKGKKPMHVRQFPESANGEVIGDHGFKELAHESDVIPQIRIDDMAEWNLVSAPTIITMDVEGSEFEVLQGAEQTIRDHKPVIFLSLHPEFLFDQWGVYGNDVRQWIKALGYSEELLDYQHEVHLVYRPIGGQSAS